MRRRGCCFLGSRAVLCQGTRVKYCFMNEHRHQHAVASMCRVLRVARAGFYTWLHGPVSDHAKEDARLLDLIRDSYSASHGVYGARRIFGDLREAGESCGLHRVERLMRENASSPCAATRSRAPSQDALPSLPPNRLQREFTVDAANKVWVTDITYVRTWQGRLYLAVVVDLYARKVVGWSMKASLSKELALDALLMAVWRRKPASRVVVHSDQGSQYGSDDFKRFCQAHNLEPSMSRRANCWGNAVAESFFSSLKKERIRKRIYKTREGLLLRTVTVKYRLRRFPSAVRRANPTRRLATYSSSIVLLMRSASSTSTISWNIRRRLSAIQLAQSLEEASSSSRPSDVAALKSIFSPGADIDMASAR
ncbi:IS3 family transposase [Mesorhizobium kowhaii]|uniref:IS3 family transposase n=1 Tax=Mesorhizobium kowhaii TaxID=1300272 RepID=UPI0035F0CB7D